MEKLRRSAQHVDDVLVQDYVKEVVEYVMPKHKNNKVLEVALLIDDEFNAFALPGGYIGVHSALFRHLNNRGQFAAIMAHEVAHVTRHHFERKWNNADKSTAIAWATLVAALVSGNATVATATVAAGQGLAIQNQLNFSREMEVDADRSGMQYLHDAHIDIRYMREALAKMQDLQRLNDLGQSPYLRTHPLSQERVLEVDLRLNEISATQQPISTTQAEEQDYAFIRARVLGTQAERDSEFARQLTQQQQSLQLPELAQTYLAACLLWQAKKHTEAWVLLNALETQTLSNYAKQVVALTQLEWLKTQNKTKWLTQAQHDQKLWTNKLAFRSHLIQALQQNGELQQATDLLRLWITEGHQALRWWEMYAAVAQAQQQDFEYLRARLEMLVLKEHYNDALNLLKSTDISRFNPSEQRILRARISAIEDLRK